MKNVKTVIFKLKNEIFLCYKLKNEEHNLEEKEKELELKLKKIKDRNLYSGKNIYNSYQDSMNKKNSLDITKQGFFTNSKINVFKNPLYKNVKIDIDNIPSELYNMNRNNNFIKELSIKTFIENLSKKSSVQEYLFLINKYPNNQHILKHLINKMKI